jgi:hypothetical protein
VAKIGDTNGFRALKSLQRAAQDARIDEIEGGGMDDGRVFLHLRHGYTFAGEGATRSVGSAAELRAALAKIITEQ